MSIKAACIAFALTLCSKRDERPQGSKSLNKTFKTKLCSKPSYNVHAKFPRVKTAKKSVKWIANPTLLPTDPFKSARSIRDELDLPVSSRTVQRRLLEKKLVGRCPRKVPLLRPCHVQARLRFAKDHYDWTSSATWWSRIQNGNLWGVVHYFVSGEDSSFKGIFKASCILSLSYIGLSTLNWFWRVKHSQNMSFLTISKYTFTKKAENFFNG